MVVPVPPTAKCWNCNYPLYGLTEPRCPECGQPFDPDDPASYWRPEYAPNWWKLGQPPNLVEVAVTGACLVTFLDDQSVPGEGFAVCGVWLVAAILFLVYLVHLEGRRERRKRLKPTAISTQSRRSWRWVVLPVAFLVATTVSLENWPLKARFLLSRAALERAATAALASPSTGTQVPRMIGLYRVRHIYCDGSGRVLLATGSTFVEWVGFWYDPAGNGGVWRSNSLDSNWSVGEY